MGIENKVYEENEVRHFFRNFHMMKSLLMVFQRHFQNPAEDLRRSFNGSKP